MNILPYFGVSSELSLEEFSRRLDQEANQQQVWGLRSSLFAEAVAKGLADVGDSLVGRKKVGGGRTVKQKYVEDVWAIVGSIKRCEAVPRTLLKNGKRSKEAWQQSQARQREAGSHITTNSNIYIPSESLVFSIDSAQGDWGTLEDKSDRDECEWW